MIVKYDLRPTHVRASTDDDLYSAEVEGLNFLEIDHGVEVIGEKVK